MPAPVIAAIIMAGATTGATIYSVHKSGQAADVGAKAQREATDAQLTASREAQAAQTAANDRALAFSREESDRQFATAEANRRGNYDQFNADAQYDADRYASRQGSISSIGERLGLPARAIPQRQIPAYVPLPGSIAAGAQNTADPKVTSAIATYQSQNPASKGIEGLVAGLKAQGVNVSRYDYGKNGGLSNNELNVNGKPYKVLGGELTPGAYWFQPGMNDSAPGAGAVMPGSIARITGGTPAPGSNTYVEPLTAAYQAPRVQAGSLRSIAA